MKAKLVVNGQEIDVLPGSIRIFGRDGEEAAASPSKEMPVVPDISGDLDADTAASEQFGAFAEDRRQNQEIFDVLESLFMRRLGGRIATAAIVEAEVQQIFSEVNQRLVERTAVAIDVQDAMRVVLLAPRIVDILREMLAEGEAQPAEGAP